VFTPSRRRWPQIGIALATDVGMSDRPHRRPDFSYGGIHQYSLTFCTLQRHRVFVTAVIVEGSLDKISRAARDHEFAILAYCFMPDHLHLLVEALSET